MHDHVEERCFSVLTATFGSREVSLKSIFKALGRKTIFHVFNLWLVSKRRHAMAADKNHIPINSRKSLFSKSTEWIKSKNISSERLFKAQDSWIPSIASICERSRAKYVFTWRQTSEFQVSNVQVFPPNCEGLLFDTAQREDDSNQQGRKKSSERRPTFNDLRN